MLNKQQRRNKRTKQCKQLCKREKYTHTCDHMKKSIANNLSHIISCCGIVSGFVLKMETFCFYFFSSATSHNSSSFAVYCWFSLFLTVDFCNCIPQFKQETSTIYYATYVCMCTSMFVYVCWCSRYCCCYYCCHYYCLYSVEIYNNKIHSLCSRISVCVCVFIKYRLTFIKCNRDFCR